MWSQTSLSKYQERPCPATSHDITKWNVCGEQCSTIRYWSTILYPQGCFSWLCIYRFNTLVRLQPLIVFCLSDDLEASADWVWSTAGLSTSGVLIDCRDEDVAREAPFVARTCANGAGSGSRDAFRMVLGLNVSRSISWVSFVDIGGVKSILGVFLSLVLPPWE